MSAEVEDSLFFQLQDEVAAELAGKAYFDGLTITSERKLDIAFTIEEAVQKAGGLFLVVSTPSGKVATEGVLGPRQERLVHLDVFEDPLINRDPESETASRKPASRIVEEASRSLHGWKPACAAQMLVYQEDEQAVADGLLLWKVIFATKLNLRSNATLRER